MPPVIKNLSDENYLIYAAQNYSNAYCTSIDEFYKDIKIIITARTLLRNYFKNGTIHIRLLLNHIITFSNIFGNHATVRLFFFRCEHNLHGYLYAIFKFLDILPEYVEETNLRTILPDPQFTKMLEEL